MPLEFVLIIWVFVKHVVSLNLIIYYSISVLFRYFCGIFCQLPDFKSRESIIYGDFFRNGAWFHSYHPFQREKNLFFNTFFKPERHMYVRTIDCFNIV